MVTNKLEPSGSFLLQSFHMKFESPVADPKSPYSKHFQELLGNGERSLLDGSHFSADFAAWERDRKPIADFIDKPGSIVDLGCANGFLLECLKEWSGKELNCYGIDTNSEAVDAAKKLFGPGQENHFFTVEEVKEKLPEKLDYAYWNVWDNAEFTEQKNREILDVLIDHVPGGRCILGFYHPDPLENEKKLHWLQENNYNVSGIKRTTSGLIFISIDVPNVEK